MKNALRLTVTLPCLCGLILFNTSCGGGHDHDHDHDHDGHDHDGKEHAEKPGDESAATPAAAAKDNYPLKVCVVSGEELGSMGEPFVLVHEGTTVKFCCDGCVDDFKDEPAPYLAKLAAATKGQ